MDTQAKPRVAIIGAGRLGGNLCAWLSDALYPVSALCSRNVDRMREIVWASQSSAALFQSPVEAAQQADIIFFTLPDSMILGAAIELASSEIDLSAKLFVHCSGAQTTEALLPLAEKHLATAVFHPIQAFTPLPNEKDLGPSPFRGISIGIEASDDGYQTLAALAQSIGANALRLSPDADARARYHAAAVLASNALVALMDAGVGLLESDGQSEEAARHALLPLVSGTVANLEKLPAGQALTGPVVRGDAATIARHLKALPENAKPLYAEAMRAATKLALRERRIDASQAAAILATLIL